MVKRSRELDADADVDADAGRNTRPAQRPKLKPKLKPKPKPGPAPEPAPNKTAEDRMVDVDAEDASARMTDRRIKLIQKRIVQYERKLKPALKLACRFETQKLIKRKKAADSAAPDQAKKQKPVDTQKLSDEMEALRTINPEEIASRHLRRLLARNKPLAERLKPHFPETFDNIPPPPPNGPVANVLARLYNANNVKLVVADLIATISSIALVSLDEKVLPKRKNQPDFTTHIVAKHTSSRRHHLPHTVPTESDSNFEVNEGELADDEVFADESLLGKPPKLAPKQASTKGEGAHLLARTGTDDEQDTAKTTKAENNDDDNDDDPFNSDDYSDEFTGFASDTSFPTAGKNVIGVEAKIKKADAKQKRKLDNEKNPARPDQDSDSDDGPLPSASTFFPSLTMNGYISNSDTASWNGDSDLDQPHGQPAKKKNRRGQRARRQIWERKYGSKAKHVLKEAEAKSADRSAGWDMKRGAQPDGQGRPGGRREGADGARGRLPATRPDGPDPSDQPARKKSKLPDPSEMHPSWLAKREAKEKQKAMSSAAALSQVQNRRVVFDD